MPEPARQPLDTTSRAAEDAIDLRVEPAADADQWDRYVDRHRHATAYHGWAWRGLVESVFRQECRYRIALDRDGRVRGVLPLVRLRSRLFGDYALSLPYVNYGGALADDEATRAALMRAAADDASELGLSHVGFRDREPVAGPWRVDERKVLMWRDLPDDPDALTRQFPGKLRYQLRRSARNPVTVETGGGELVDDFYAVFARNMRDLGTPVYGRRLFAEALSRLPGSFIALARHRGRPAAAGILVPSRDRLEIPWASSLRKLNSTGVNMLLYQRCLHEAIERGYRIFDFGRSTVDSGTYQFKRQWGARQVPCYWHYWVAGGGEPPGLSPDDPKYRWAIAVWQRLPVGIANCIGPSIVRNLP